MTTTSNDQTNPLGACGADTNKTPKLYDVTVHRTDYFVITMHVVATTEAEAERFAEAVARNHSQWNPMESDCYAVEVRAVEGGQDND